MPTARPTATSRTLARLAESLATGVRRAPATSEQDAATLLYYMLGMYEAPGWRPCLGRPVGLGLRGKKNLCMTQGPAYLH